MQVTIENPIQTESAKPKSVAYRLTVLAALMLLVGGVASAVGILLFKVPVPVPLIALGACLVSALFAHVAGEYPKGHLYITARMAVQIVARTVLPFIVSVWGLYFADPPFEKSLVLFMILFYLVGLVADVQLSLGRIKAESELAG